jgi:glycogen debranching enzyme
VNQAWKDSYDSIFHADGRFPRGPVAVVEVQGYAYAALEAMSELAATRGDQARSDRWMQRSQRLRAAIEERFWVPQMNYYAIALDGDGEPCKVYGSNAGHLLFCGVPSEERAAAVAAQLLSSRFASGWGIRTLAEGEPRYNPMSYHNGSIWPHDTSVCAAGLSRYGAVLRVPAHTRPGSGAVSGGLPAAGLVLGHRVPVAAGEPGHSHRRPSQ